MPATAFSSGTFAPRRAAQACHAQRGVAAQAARRARGANRRDAVLAVAASALLFAPQQAQALFEDINEVYANDTKDLLKKIQNVVSMEGGDKEAAVDDVKKDMNSWTSKYRTNGKTGGKPSFSNMYSAVNALAGHWNSFGADTPVPKKRYTRIEKQMNDVGKLLERGR